MTCRGRRLHNCLIYPQEIHKSQVLIDRIQKDDGKWESWLRDIGARAGITDDDRGHVSFGLFPANKHITHP